MNTKLFQQAIVIGGSVAGLAAARAISPYAEKVSIIERDENPNSFNPRKAVPQSYHAHALLKGGELALEALFPNITLDLQDCGARRIDFSQNVRWYHAKRWKIRFESGIKVMVQSRPLLEQLIRQRIAALGNVEHFYGYEVENLKLDASRKKVEGVSLQKMNARSEKLELSCDLLIDASGRGSKTPQWLGSFGYAAPKETRLKIDLSYSSRLYQAPEGKHYDWDILIINTDSPKFLRAGYIFPMENNQYLVTLSGYSGDETPKTNETFMEFAKGLAQDDIYRVMQDFTPINDVKYYGLMETSRRHYESISMPQGLLVMGDANCVFDPVYGQGMSVAAQEAWALSEMLAKESPSSLMTLGKRFHKKAAQIVEVPWMFGSSEDFRYPNTVGEKSALVPILHWYSQQLFELSGMDEEVFQSFGNVMHLLTGAEALFKPSVFFKVMKHSLSN